MNDYIVLARKKKYALLKNLRNGEYIVASGYDDSKPDGEKWDCGTYFGNDVMSLTAAVERFRSRTETSFITRERLCQLATQFIDCINGDDDMECVVDDMESYEREFFSNIKTVEE